MAGAGDIAGRCQGSALEYLLSALPRNPWELHKNAAVLSIPKAQEWHSGFSDWNGIQGLVTASEFVKLYTHFRSLRAETSL